MDYSSDEDVLPLGWGRAKYSRTAEERAAMGSRYLSNRKGRSFVQSQGLNILLLAGMVGGVGFIARKFQESRAGKVHLGTEEADTSNGEEEDEVFDGIQKRVPSGIAPQGIKEEGSPATDELSASKSNAALEDDFENFLRNAKGKKTAVEQEYAPTGPSTREYLASEEGSSKEVQGSYPESGEARKEAVHPHVAAEREVADEATSNTARKSRGEEEGEPANETNYASSIPGFKLAEGVDPHSGGAKKGAEEREAERREEAAAMGKEDKAAHEASEEVERPKKTVEDSTGAAELEEALGAETQSLEDTPEEHDAAVSGAATKKDVGESGEGVASTKSRGTEESVEGKNGPVESVREDGQPEEKKEKATPEREPSIQEELEQPVGEERKVPGEEEKEKPTSRELEQSIPKKLEQPILEKERSKEKEQPTETESASKDSDGKTLERKLSKEEIISSVAQRFGVKADLEAPNSFTADIDTLDSITQELLEKDSNSEAGKEPPAENEPPRGGKDSSDVGKEKEGSSSGVDNEEAGAVVGKEGGGAETTSHTPQKDGKIAAGDGKDESALDVVPESPRKEGAEEVAQQGNGIADHKDGTGSNRQIKGGKSGGKKKGKR